MEGESIKTEAFPQTIKVCESKICHYDTYEYNTTTGELIHVIPVQCGVNAKCKKCENKRDSNNKFAFAQYKVKWYQPEVIWLCAPCVGKSDTIYY